MSRIAAALFILCCACAPAADDGLVAAWRFDAANTSEKIVKAERGPLDATIVGPVRFSGDKPQSLLLDGDSTAGQRVSITGDIKKAALPAKAITVEAWVWINRTQEWGGIAGAMQDNGNYEKGWLLGYSHQQFFFAVASKGKNSLTYLKSQNPFQIGYWYHVIGVYDGKEQRLYVDGRLQALSREQSGDIDYPAEAYFTLGAYHDKDELYSMDGRLNRAGVFQRALSAAEIAARFERQSPEFPGAQPRLPDVVDWPTYLRDGQRTAQSPENFSFPLRLKWVHAARFAPRPAWPEEASNDYYHKRYNLGERVTYDRALHLVGVGGSVYFSSSADDKVYCLDAETGAQRWEFFTEGPVRLAPVISGERVLFGSDDGFVYALDARDGSLQWKRRLAPEPRLIPGNERIVSAWPVRTDVFVEDGKAYVCAGIFVNQGVYRYTLDPKTGDVLETSKIKNAAQGYQRRFFGQLQSATGRDPAGAFVASLSAQGKDAGPGVSTLARDYPFAFIGAGNARFGGGNGKLAAFSADDGRELWSAAVDGKVYSLAVVNGRLLASTDTGRIYCFVPGKTGAAPLMNNPPPAVGPAWRDAAEKQRVGNAANAIIQKAGLQRGYCLVLGSGDGRLVHELAARTQWRIIGREADAQKAELSRRMLDAAGLAGRAVIHHGSLDSLPYTDYLFNVVAIDSVSDALQFARAEALRVLRPEGGVAILGAGEHDVIVRGPIEGAGEWTHLYGDAGNSACSHDKVISGEREMLIQWFGPPGPRGMVDRHHRTTAPLYKNGRLFVPGDNRVTAVDAYNGTILWENEIPDSRRVVVFRDSSYLALSDEALYVAAPAECLALDPQTGKTLRTLQIPAEFRAKPMEWGYLAAVGDLIVASAARPGSSRRKQSHELTVTETHWDGVPIVGSDGLFALNRKDGSKAWTYAAQKGLIVNPTIASDGTSLYFVESANPGTLTKDVGRAKLEELVGKGAALTALDLKTGKVRWSQPVGSLEAVRHNLFLSCAKNRLVLAGSYNSGANKKTDRLLYEICVFDAAAGTKLWSKTQKQSDAINGEHGEQERHPVIVGDTVYLEPLAYSIHSGAPVDWKWPWQGKRRTGCGTLSASESCFFFRNETVSLFNLAQGEVRKVTSETRPGCWINLLPVGGLLLAPEASSGCTCNFAVQTSLAFIPASVEKK